MTEVLRVKEFCRLYGIGRTTAYALAKRGEIDMLRMGVRHTVVTEESARRWSRSRTPVYPTARNPNNREQMRTTTGEQLKPTS